QRHPLFPPDVRGKGGRVGVLRVSADEAEGGTGAAHGHPADAVTGQPEAAGLVELDLDGLADAEVAARELDDAVGGVGHGVLNGRRVVALAVALGAETTDVAHLPPRSPVTGVPAGRPAADGPGRALARYCMSGPRHGRRPGERGTTGNDPILSRKLPEFRRP